MSKISCARRSAVVAAVAAAMGVQAKARAADFDPTSPAVLQAYVGSATPEKIDAALAGLNAQIARAAVIPNFGSNFGSFHYDFYPGSFSVIVISPGGTVLSSSIRAASDADLGVAGAPVTLDDAQLTMLASFATPRNFTVGPGVGFIYTNGFDLTISGTVTTTAVLTKSGTGALILTGANPWGVAPSVAGGLLKAIPSACGRRSITTPGSSSTRP